MLLSMTGYGAASGDAPCGKITIEIQSVNRKFLDVHLFLPKEFSFIEHEIRKWISEKLIRGQVNVRLFFTPKFGELPLSDFEQLKAYKEGWETLAKKLGYDSKQVDLAFLLLHAPLGEKKPIFSEKDVKNIQAIVESAIQQFLEKMESLAANVKGPTLEEQMVRELFFFAEKIDITEEITRLRSHFDQMHLIDSGKKIEFLLQEMGREINTIGSKVLDAEISHYVVEMKGELEKMKEQVQNVE